MTKRANDTRTLLDKIEEYTIENANGCWVWQLSKNNVGYGFMRDGDKMRTVHRVSYEEHSNTKIPSNTCVIHHCSNYACANPAHLFLGSRQDLINEMQRKGTHKFWGEGRTGKIAPSHKCPHCNRHIANNLFNRWHGDNCKLKSIA